jgi:fibronectin type 3 domain-containing protein
VVTLAWDANTEANLAGYKVYVGDSSGVYSTSFDVGDVTTFTVTDLQPARLYYFAVTAYDQNASESSFSYEVSTTL